MKPLPSQAGTRFSQPLANIFEALQCLLGSFAIALAVQMLDGSSLATSAQLLLNASFSQSLLSPTTGTTLGIITGALGIAISCGFSAAWISHRLGLGLPDLTAFGGRLVAALPICGVAWFSIGMLISRCGLPVESLLTYPPPPEPEQWPIPFARQVWSWLTPVLILSVPLLAQWLALSVAAIDDTSSNLTTRAVDTLSEAQLRHQYLWSAAWHRVLPNLNALANTAIVYDIIIEYALGLTGWGHHLASGIFQHQATAIAHSVLMLGGISALFSLLTSLISPSSAVDHSWPTRAHRFSMKSSHAIMLLGLLLLLFSVAAHHLFLRDQPWAKLINTASAIASQFPNYFTAQVFLHLPAFSSDLVHTAIASAFAMLSLLLFRGISALLLKGNASTYPSRPLPWLLWCLAIAGLAKAAPHLDLILGVSAGIAQVQAARFYSYRLHQHAFVEASLSLGVSRMMIWIRHIFPSTLRFHLAWLMVTFGNLLLWRLVFTSLSNHLTHSSLGVNINALSRHAIHSPSALLFPTLLVALVIVSAQQASRLICSELRVHNS